MALDSAYLRVWRMTHVLVYNDERRCVGTITSRDWVSNEALSVPLNAHGTAEEVARFRAYQVLFRRTHPLPFEVITMNICS